MWMCAFNIKNSAENLKFLSEFGGSVLARCFLRHVLYRNFNACIICSFPQHKATKEMYHLCRWWTISWGRLAIFIASKLPTTNQILALPHLPTKTQTVKQFQSESSAKYGSCEEKKFVGMFSQDIPDMKWNSFVGGMEKNGPKAAPENIWWWRSPSKYKTSLSVYHILYMTETWSIQAETLWTVFTSN